MEFNFERSDTVIEAFGCGCFGKPGWQSLQMRFTGKGKKADIVVDVTEIKFVINEIVGTHTSAPCFDPESNVMAFPSQMHLDYYLKHWNISVN